MGPECKDPPNPGANICIVQLSGEGTVGATVPQVHPHYHRSLPEWLNAATGEGPHLSTQL
jgi:hypothetical protein